MFKALQVLAIVTSVLIVGTCAFKYQCLIEQLTGSGVAPPTRAKL